MKYYAKGLLLLSALVMNAFLALAEDAPTFLGTWEYRQRAGDGYDLEGEKLELKRRGRVVSGLYFGLEREGEHGLFYSLVEIRDVKIEGDRISFIVPARHLFVKRPKNKKEAKRNERQSNGFTGDELKMRGQLKDGRLIIGCTSIRGSCPEALMEFRKGSWSKG